ncbi:MAG: hypothetical protein WCP18_00200 [bacterium]
MWQKKPKHKIKYFLLIIFSALFIISGLLFWHFQTSQADQSVPFYGWVWSENYGWISLNSDNCAQMCLADPVNCGCTNVGQSYGIKKNPDKTINGYGWSEYIGWVCFGDTCSANPPFDSTSTMSIDTNGNISGWAQVLSMGEDGWMKFGGYKGSVPNGQNYSGEACYDCTKKCGEWTTTYYADGTTSTSSPCVVYVPNEFSKCNTCFTATKFNNTPYASANLPGQKDSAVVGGSGYMCSSCNNCQVEGNTASDHYRVKCSDCQSGNCYMYGVGSDTSNSNQLVGWGWSGGSNGVGWVHFNGEVGIVNPWLETKYGSIYSSSTVGQKASNLSYNATYCIFANNLQNINVINVANCTEGNVADSNLGFPSSPVSTGQYQNVLGKIDVKGLMTTVKGSYNKYGQEVVMLEDPNALPDVLDNKIYVVSSTGHDLSLSNPKTFKNGTETERGNGLVIVKGNLFIGNDISYESNSPSDLKQLASVGWLVLGDVVVSPTVKNIVGAFVLLGGKKTDGNQIDCNKDIKFADNFPKYKQNGCGAFFSFNPEYKDTTNFPLNVYGLIVSHAFDLRRTYTSLSQGSESIIYDGRLSVNPPPGMTGFVEALPVIRDFEYK